MLTPFDHKGTDLFQYISLIAQNLASLLEANKENVKLSQRDNRHFFEIILSRQSIHNIKNDSESKEETSRHFLLETSLTKDFWFNKKNIEIMSIANVNAYCFQVILFYFFQIHFQDIDC